MSRHAVYLANGEIIRIINVPDFMDDAQANALSASESIAVVPDWVQLGRAYFSGGAPLQRSELSLTVSATQVTANGTDTVTISGIPAGVEVNWPDGVVTSGDATIEFDTDLAGPHRFRFTAVEYLEKEVTIEAVAAT